LNFGWLLSSSFSLLNKNKHDVYHSRGKENDLWTDGKEEIAQRKISRNLCADEYQPQGLCEKSSHGDFIVGYGEDGYDV
jgi:hypothetical protein